MRKVLANKVALVAGATRGAGRGIAVELGAAGATVYVTMLEEYGVTEENWQDATVREPHFIISESPRYVGRAVAALAADPEVGRWNGQSLSSGQLAQVYGFTDLDGSQPDAWRYMIEVQDAGKVADATGYR